MRSAMAVRAVGLVVGLALAVSIGCSDARDPVATDPPDAELHRATYPAPGGLVTADGFEFLPYTLNNYQAENQDPINLIFTGNVDPLSIRAALMSLDGDRSGLGAINPALAPLAAFDCTWKDALGGDEQVTYAGDKWAGSVVQLACGDYQPYRVHMRLFQAGTHTVANAHFEILIPGTADHQVLSWELAETLVWADFVRSGLGELAGVAPGINEAPTFRDIIPQIFNALPGDLKYIVTGDPGYVADAPVGIPSDGNATIVHVTTTMRPTPGAFEQHITLPYDIVAPKPICNPNGDKFINITGSVDLWQTDVLTRTGEYRMDFRASGKLTVTPVNPLTGEAIGAPQTAIVQQEQFARLWHRMASTSRRFAQTLLPVRSAEGGRSVMVLQWGPMGLTRYNASEICGS
jgi:hypothetical protein